MTKKPKEPKVLRRKTPKALPKTLYVPLTRENDYGKARCYLAWSRPGPAGTLDEVTPVGVYRLEMMATVRNTAELKK